MLKKVGRRPIPEEHQRAVIKTCDRLGIRTVGFYVLGFNTDTWDSIAATIEYSISLGSTLAQFKMLTPYPGTPLWKHMEEQVFEKDWEHFDGFSVTFNHPNLSAPRAAVPPGRGLRPLLPAPVVLREPLALREAVGAGRRLAAGPPGGRDALVAARSHAISRAVEC